MAQQQQGSSDMKSSERKGEIVKPSKQSGGLERGRSERRGSTEGMIRADEWPSFGSSMAPFSIMRRLADDMDRLFYDFGRGRLPFLADVERPFGAPLVETSLFIPDVEIFERDGEWVLHCDLPGLNKEDVNIELHQDRIIVRGERQREKTEEKRGVVRSERSYGSFVRSVALPEGADVDSATAHFRNGVLEISVPMPEQSSKVRRLEIMGEDEKRSTSTH